MGCGILQFGLNQLTYKFYGYVIISILEPPLDDDLEDDEFDLNILHQSRQTRRKSSNPPSESSAIWAILLLSAIVYFVWCGYYYHKNRL